jgi:hypothetical protein
MGRRRVSLLFSAAIVAAVPAAAPAAAQPGDDQPAEGTPKQEGEYGGVRPGQPSPEGSTKKARRPSKGTLMWLGFLPKEGGASELFVQSVAPFTVSQRLEGKTLVVLLEGLRRLDHNTRRPLDTRFFDTALARVKAKVVRAKRARKGVPGHPAGVELRVTFKDAGDAREAMLRTDTAADGSFFAYLGFAAPARPGQIPDQVDRPETSRPR